MDSRARAPTLVCAVLLFGLMFGGAALAVVEDDYGWYDNGELVVNVKEIYYTPGETSGSDAAGVRAGCYMYKYVVATAQDGLTLTSFSVANPSNIPVIDAYNDRLWSNPSGTPVAFTWAKDDPGDLVIDGGGMTGTFKLWTHAGHAVTTGTVTGTVNGTPVEYTGTTTGPIVPEPATLSLMALGLVGLVRRRRTV